jgi:hypothetical protein
MTKREAIKCVRNWPDDAGEDQVGEDLEEIFAALAGHPADDTDREHLFSHCVQLAG